MALHAIIAPVELEFIAHSLKPQYVGVIDNYQHHADVTVYLRYTIS